MINPCLQTTRHDHTKVVWCHPWRPVWSMGCKGSDGLLPKSLMDAPFLAATFHNKEGDRTFLLEQQVRGQPTPECLHQKTIFAKAWGGYYHGFGKDEVVWKGERISLDHSKMVLNFRSMGGILTSASMTFSDATKMWGVDFGSYYVAPITSGSSVVGKVIDKWSVVSFHADDASKVTIFEINGGGLVGEINNLDALVELKTLLISNTQISGSIPSLVHNPALVTLSLMDNALTGAIPDLSANVALSNVNLTNNDLTGPVPDMSHSPRLVYFDVSSNRLSGIIPSISANTYLNRYDVSGNDLSGFAGGWPTVVDVRGFTFDASDNNLTDDAVNKILIDAQAAGAGAGTTIDLRGGVNLAPQGLGIVAKNSLIAAGAVVSTN